MKGFEPLLEFTCPKSLLASKARHAWWERHWPRGHTLICYVRPIARLCLHMPFCSNKMQGTAHTLVASENQNHTCALTRTECSRSTLAFTISEVADSTARRAACKRHSHSDGIGHLFVSNVTTCGPSPSCAQPIMRHLCLRAWESELCTISKNSWRFYIGTDRHSLLPCNILQLAKRTHCPRMHAHISSCSRSSSSESCLLHSRRAQDKRARCLLFPLLVDMLA